ncbi:MAG: response regulator transcription factor [Vicinamibacterales bacterium]
MFADVADSSPVPRIDVLLAEDHETVREGLTLLIDSQPDMHVVGVVPSGREVLERVRTLKPRVVVMDVSMPDVNGLVATRELKQAGLDASVVVLTRHDDDGYVRELLSAGASAYVLKRSPSSELLAAVRAAASGRDYVDNALGARMANVIRRTPSRGPSATPQVSDRENQVLRLVAQGHSNKEIAAELGISVKTVEVHKGNAMKKLGFRSRIDVVQYGLLQGWLRDD